MWVHHHQVRPQTSLRGCLSSQGKPALPFRAAGYSGQNYRSGFERHSAPSVARQTGLVLGQTQFADSLQMPLAAEPESAAGPGAVCRPCAQLAQGTIRAPGGDPPHFPGDRRVCPDEFSYLTSP